MHLLFLVSDGLDRPCELDLTSPDRPVVRIRRGQVFSAEFAQLLSDLFREVEPTAPRPREVCSATRQRVALGPSIPIEALAGVVSSHSAVPEQSVIR